LVYFEIIFFNSAIKEALSTLNVENLETWIFLGFYPSFIITFSGLGIIPSSDKKWRPAYS
jgi:hypothetical protein